MDLNWLSIADAHKGLKAKDFSAVEYAQSCLNQIEKTKDLNTFITITDELALAQAEKVDAKLAAGKEIGVLEGIPGALKDLFNTKGVQTTSGSNILKGYIAPYDATVVKKLNEAGYVPIGKNNMDEFACGVSNETSAYGPVHNPWKKGCVPGGSSGGSVASVSAGQVPFAIGTDTGGSIRQPAALCSVVGLKPTYGRVSRFGANAMASSFDHVGPITRTVQDAALVLQAIAGHDPYDATSPSVEVPDYSKNLAKGVEGMTFGIPEEFFYMDGVSEEVRDTVMVAVKEFEKMGATLKPVKMPLTKYGVAVYYVLTPGELSTNLARFDGIRFGQGAEAGFSELQEYYKATRGEGFGDEIKRRIMMGTFMLSAGYADAFYKQAQRVRTMVVQEFEETFKEVDAILAPTSPIVTFGIGEKVEDPMAMYALDSLTIPADSAGVPAVSIPCGFNKDGLPIGMQVIAPQFEESRMLQIAAAYEQATGWHKEKPL
jgi:aspartyl-tRNA(Asn)/glutamyl-tRNA(Gln) amidotransferase subunit A